MSRKHALLRGTFILTAAGLLSRIMGFFYRIFLSRTFGAEGVGLYQLIFPVFTICFSITTAGIETAISRTIASRSAKNKEKESMNILFTGIFCSLILSFLCIFIVHKNSYFIANELLNDSRCESLINILIYALPFSSIHSCIAGYYYGKKQPKIPALCQLVEQTSRILTVFLLSYLFIKKEQPLPLTITVAGLIIGDAVSTFYAISSLNKVHRTLLSYAWQLNKDHRILLSYAWQLNKGSSYHSRKFKFSYWSVASELLTLSIPLTVNRLLLNLLQSIEAVSIPAQLQKYCFSNAEALATYGVLNGMALPCILFPSAITTSAAAMLMPTVAEIQAIGDRHKIIAITKKSCGLCFLLGLFCCLVFLITGRWMGIKLFKNESAGNFILTLAWICPFLYTNTAFQGVINGLGKTRLTLFINIIGLTIRISSVYLFIPKFGIKGYLWGLLASQLIISIISAAIIGLLYKDSLSYVFASN